MSGCVQSLSRNIAGSHVQEWQEEWQSASQVVEQILGGLTYACQNHSDKICRINRRIIGDIAKEQEANLYRVREKAERVYRDNSRWMCKSSPLLLKSHISLFVTAATVATNIAMATSDEKEEAMGRILGLAGASLCSSVAFLYFTAQRYAWNPYKEQIKMILDNKIILIRTEALIKMHEDNTYEDDSITFEETFKSSVIKVPDYLLQLEQLQLPQEAITEKNMLALMERRVLRYDIPRLSPILMPAHRRDFSEPLSFA